jgi:proline dehydrogenase
MKGERLLQLVADQDAVRDAARPVTEHLPVEQYVPMVAGESMDDALRHTRGLDDDNVTALIDLLGEHVEDPATVARDQAEYETVQQRIAERDLDAHLSVKPSHLGLDVTDDDMDAYTYCRDNLYTLAEQAAEHDRCLWIDMESTDYTQDTLDLYTDLQNDFDNVGVCIQAYLERSADDIATLTDNDGTVRLVKGAYADDNDYDDWEQVGDVYGELLEDLFMSDTYFAVATHDEELIEYAQHLAHDDTYPQTADDFEFQFLMGVRDDRQRELAEQGYTVSQYVPYGPDWFDYFWRRVQEKPENITVLAKSVADSLRP